MYSGKNYAIINNNLLLLLVHSFLNMVILATRACLKKAFCKMCVTICGIFCPDEGAAAGYGN